MEFDKDAIVNMLESQGKHDQATQAQQQLPNKVDHEKHGDLLNSIGVNPMDLVSNLKSKL